MDAIRVNENTRVNQVSSRAQLVRSDSNLIDFFIGDKMKRCSKCQQIKQLSEFYKAKGRRDGYQRYCKLCKSKYQKEYFQIEKNWIARKQQSQSREYRDRYVIYQTNHRKTKKGRKNSRKQSYRYRVKYPERRKAVDAVYYAVKTGKLPQPDTLQCSCGNHQAEQYHHWSYLPEHRLDVIPVCCKCHKQIHIYKEQQDVA